MRFGYSWPGTGRKTYWVSVGPGTLGIMALLRPFYWVALGLVWLYVWGCVGAAWLAAEVVWILGELVVIGWLKLRKQRPSVTFETVRRGHMPPVYHLRIAR